jgi:hypothetical protein
MPLLELSATRPLMVKVGGAETTWHGENSEVLPEASVAVAVMKVPGATPTGKEAPELSVPLLSVLAARVPMSVSPSPLPEASQFEFE